MRIALLIVLSGAIMTLYGADWASRGGNPQRDGWARGEQYIVKANVRNLRLLYTEKLDNRPVGLNALTSPIVLSNLITYRGFKEMLFVGGSSDNVYAVDADLNRLLWKTHLVSRGDNLPYTPAPGCPGGLTASIAITGGSGAMVHRFNKHPPTKKAAAEGVFSSGFGRNGDVFAIDSEGYLRFVRQSDGDADAVPGVKFVPSRSTVTGINLNGTVVYASTVDGCGGTPNALYAIDLGGEERNVVSFVTNGSGLAGSGGTAIDTEGTVYAQVDNGHGEVAGDYNDTVLALNPEDLKVTDYFTPSGAVPAIQSGAAFLGVTPTVFPWNGKELVVAGGRDGTVYLLDAKSLGGADHRTPLYHTEPLASADAGSANHGIFGNFSTWEDADSGTRWVYAAFRGPVGAAAKLQASNGAAPHGSILAFKVEEQAGKPVLALQWVSRDLLAPESPVTTNGLVIALSTGDASGTDAKNGTPYTPEEREAMSTRATMYVLDGTTGKELFSSSDAVTTFSHGSGLALANSRIYFTTHDNTVYCYGLPAREPQLTEH